MYLFWCNTCGCKFETIYYWCEIINCDRCGSDDTELAIWKLIDLIEEDDNTFGVVETETHNIEVSISKLLGVLEWVNRNKHKST